MSFDEVYSKYFHELRRFGRHMNISAERSEDLTQEVFLRYFLELKKNVVFENPRAWLYKVFLNLLKTHIKSNKYDLVETEPERKLNETTADLHEEFTKNEKNRIVLEMLDHLTEKEKEILLLYHNGFTYAEMAEILGLNPNSVGTTLVRAIEKLKTTLKTQYHEMFE